MITECIPCPNQLSGAMQLILMGILAAEFSLVERHLLPLLQHQSKTKTKTNPTKQLSVLDPLCGQHPFHMPEQIITGS